MSDALGDALRKAAAPPPSPEPPPSDKDDDVVNLLNGSAEPTDDSPTVISKAQQLPAVVRTDDNFSAGLRGRRLAHFELIEPIGVGGMAAVLRARDTQLDRLVALKILPREMAADPENVRRFHQEARSAARLDHENIARVFFCGEDQRLYFIAFEFVEGDNLRTILEKRGRLPVGEALHYMLQVAAGLAHAASRGVVHRDIKPSNIIITPNGRAKLVDMGLARSLEPQHDQGLTQSGVTLGTFDYISPEQAMEPRDADVRSDIYSLGCTFYHVLTGQPPVPEGTGLNKLYHHQHVKPPDPRQLVPDLPDEVAIILDRMMAKQPKDRYQTPEQLVHHLYVAAHKLGAAGEVPEGVLAVEAALPSPPPGRPLILAALAAVAVVGLVFLLDSASTPKFQPARNPRPDSSPSVANPESGPSRPPAPDTKNVAENPTIIQNLDKTKDIPIFNKEKPTAADLAAFLNTNRNKDEIILELDDLILRDRESDLVVTNPKVTIRQRKPGQRATIRDQYRALVSQSFQATLTIESKTCTIENLRFVLEQTGASVPMAMLCFRNTQNVDIRRCEFIQIDPRSQRDSRLTSILAESDRPLATVRVTESCFLGFGSLGLAIKSGDGQEDMVFQGPTPGGQDALTRSGPVRVEASNCLFGPHAATFRLEGSAPGDSGLVRLEHCTVLAANPSAVYDVADNADAQIESRFSLFSYPGELGMMGIEDSSAAVLLRRASIRGQVDYRGHDNRYHHLSYLVVADASTEKVRSLLESMKIKESEELEKSPWNEQQPLDPLKNQVVNASAIKAAFKVNPDRLELRVRRSEKAHGQLIGAERVLAFSYVDKLLPLKESPVVPTPRERVVRKGARPDFENLVFPSLELALVGAAPGEVIRLQVNGEVKLNPSWLSHNKAADLLIRADPGFHPILTLDAAEPDDEVSALVKIGNGKLQLEGLEIRLAAPRDGECCSVVSFFGDGELILKSCLVTLERSARKIALAMLPQQRMKKTPSAPAMPRLVVENCFIRGQGDLMCMHEGHAAEIIIDNSLIALSGSLLNVESEKKGAKEEALAAGAPLTLRLQKVTTYLGENLIRLHAAQEVKSLSKTRCEATDCLFLPAKGQPLVHLEGPDGEEKGLREKLSWESSGKNAYGTFTTLLEQQTLDTMRMPVTSKQDSWQRDVSGETSSQYNVKLSDPPAAEAAFTQLLPKTFQPADGLKGFGADLAALITLPALKEKPEVPDSDFDVPEFDESQAP